MLEGMPTAIFLKLLIACVFHVAVCYQVVGRTHGQKWHQVLLKVYDHPIARCNQLLELTVWHVSAYHKDFSALPCFTTVVIPFLCYTQTSASLVTDHRDVFSFAFLLDVKLSTVNDKMWWSYKTDARQAFCCTNHATASTRALVLVARLCWVVGG